LLQRGADKRLEFLRIPDDSRPIGREQLADNITKVPRVGSKACCYAVGGRFEHVLPAAGAEAAADKTDVGGAPPGAELADGVDQQGAPPAIC
jgi:hypothetical protein